MIIHHAKCHIGRGRQQLEGTRRAGNRRGQRSLRCELGDVLDLSPGGMRVMGRKHPQGTFTIQLFALDKSADIKGKVVWSRRHDQFKVELGIAFTNVTRLQARQIEDLARMQQTRML